MTATITINKEELLVKMVLDGWRSKISQLDKLIAELPDEQLSKEVAPGRNRGIYLLGHLTALADSVVPLLGYGEKHAPHLFKPFVQTPDKENATLPSVQEVRQDWNKVKTALDKQITDTATDEWFKKHTAVSEEDFAKEPHRNKLNVILGRIGHMDYHIGQLTFLKNK
jgi:hypothetical protein